MVRVSIPTSRYEVPFTYDMPPGIWVCTHVCIQLNMYNLHFGNSASYKTPQQIAALLKVNCTGRAFVISSLWAQGEGEGISPSKSSDSLWINKFSCLKCRFLSSSKSTHLEFLLPFQSTEFKAGKLLQKTL